MEKSRTKQSLANIAAALTLKVLQMVLPFCTRTIIVRKLGIEYVGIAGLFTSIIGVLSLAEMGAGSALVYAMYKPIKDKDERKICAIINLYKKVYFIIGITIAVLGLIITPFLKVMIKKGTYPSEINIYLIFIIFLFNTIISYLVFAYKASLFDAFQMGYLVSKVKIGMLLIQYVMQIGILLIIPNYYFYIIITPFSTLLGCILIGMMSDKVFHFKAYGNLNKEDKESIIQKIKSLFLYKVGSIVLNSVDSIIISWVFGAVILGGYNNYYYIVSSLSGLLLAMTPALTPSVGNSLISKSKKENYEDFMVFSMGYNYILSWFVICLVCLLQPFIKIWIGDLHILPTGCVFLFGVYFLCFRIGDVVGWYKDGAGLWEKDKYRPFISSIINLILNISLVHIIGIYGIIISTIIALAFINYPIAVKILLDFFDTNIKEYITQQIWSLVALLSSLAITYFLCNIILHEDGKNIFFVRMIICIVVPNLVMLLFYCRNKNFKRFILFIKKRIG